MNVSNSSLSITGATAELGATAQKSYAYGILAQNGSELAIKADTAITANAAGDAIGVALIANEASKTNYAGNADITGSLSVSAKSANSDAYGVYNPAEDGASGHSEYGRLTVSGDGDIEAASEKGDAFGIYATGESAVTSIGGSTDIQAAAPEGYSIGIVTENSSSMSLGSEKSTARISATGAQSYAVAVRTSSLSLTGTTAEINATAQKDYAYGILSLDGSDLAIAADTAVTAEAAGEAFGVALLANDVPDTSYAGNAEITGDLSVSAKSANSDAYGVYNPAADGASGHDEYGTLTVSGDGDISATAENGDAYGIYAAGENAETSIGGNTTIEASAPEGKSYGVLARKAARLSMGGDGASTTITATGADSTAVALEDTSSMSVTGATALEADKALAGSGTLSNTGDLEVVRGTVDSFTGTYTQNSGSTSLTSDSNFFGGDVTIKKGSLTVGDIDTSAASGADSILGLGNSIEVQPGKNLLIGTDSGTGVVFGAESALVVNGIAAAQSPMITGSGTITVEAGSQLYITNAKASQAYTITKGLTGDSYWTEANLVLNNLIKVSLYRDGDAFVVKTSVKDLNTVFPGIIPSNALTTMLVQGLNDTDSSYMGIRFLSRATEPLYMSDNARAVDTVNEVSRAAVTAGVQNTSMRLADAAADTVMKHLSLASFDSENSIHKDGIDVWATPMYGNTWTHDMSTSVCGNYGGLAIGADVHLGTLAGGNVRAGIAVSGGGGHSKTRDNVTSTDNSYNFGGVSLYGGWTLDNLNIMASVGYNMGRHELEMSLPSSLGMGSAEADVYTRAFTADLRAEYLFKTDFLDIMPHIGVRYTALYTDEYDLEVNNSRLNSVESGMQNIVQFPVGVTFSKDIAVSGWIVKPQVDLAVVPAVGDLGAVSEISWSGINATDDVSTRIMDTVSYTGRAGIQAEMGNFAIGLNYGIQAAKHETNHSLNAGFTWKF
ncbi:MAG: autotransporter outer membrane beta-barrel domain-containing protein [Desulfovibrionaceae bacterium]|nr:autotransporter outer membrane beta-barrel domain-containing protein [Desulfovibrionaceae bacterium]